MSVASRFADARHDLAYTVRALRRAPGYTLLVVAVLALGIGATTGVFSIVHAVLLHPLPYRGADRLATAFETRDDGNARVASYPTFLDWRAALPDLGARVAGLAFVRGASHIIRVTPDAAPERLTAAYVTPGFFGVAGSAARIGRTFAPDEERAGGSDVAVLSYAFWQQRFGGDRATVGRSLSIDGKPVTVIGVMPPGFAYPSWANLWRPIATIESTDSALAKRGVHVDSRVLVRYGARADSTAVASAFNVLEARLAAEYPVESGHWTKVAFLPVRTELLGGIGGTLWMLAAAVGFVLVLACANVANLSMVRAAGRGRELAVRLALGAGRRRLARQFLLESGVLAAAGAIAGVGLAAVIVGVVRRTAAQQLPRADELGLSGPAIAFAAGAAVLVAVACAAAPAIGATRAALIDRLRAGTLGAVGGRREARGRALLVMTQLALAMMLLIGAGLLLRSFGRLSAVPLGFEPDGLIASAIDLPAGKYATPAEAAALYQRILDAVRPLPGVRAAALVNHAPLTGSYVESAVDLPGRPPARDGSSYVVYRTVSDAYLGTMRMRLAAGRWFSADDMRAPAGLVVINQTMAKQFWPNERAVGQRLTLHRASQARPDFGQPIDGVVIGVVDDVHEFGQGATVQPAAFVPYTLEVWPWITLVVRATSPASVIPALRRALLTVEPALPIGGDQVSGGVSTMQALVQQSRAAQRFTMALLAAFAAGALALAAFGLYGVAAYSVSQRSREMGIRLAVGATPRTLFALILREAALVTLIGMAVGAAGALALGRLVRSLLFDIAPTDPTTFLLTAAVLAAASIAATWLPARRAARVDPVVVMRGD